VNHQSAFTTHKSERHSLRRRAAAKGTARLKLDVESSSESDKSSDSSAKDDSGLGAAEPSPSPPPDAEGDGGEASGRLTIERVLAHRDEEAESIWRDPPQMPPMLLPGSVVEGHLEVGQSITG